MNDPQRWTARDLEIELMRKLDDEAPAPETFIAIRELSGRFGVSIHTIREAIQRLCAVGVLELRGGRLYRVDPHLARSTDNLWLRLRASVGGPRREQAVGDWYAVKRDLMVLALARCTRAGVDRTGLLRDLWRHHLDCRPVTLASTLVDEGFEVMAHAVDLSGSTGANLIFNSLCRGWEVIRPWALLAADWAAEEKASAELFSHLERRDRPALLSAFERHHRQEAERVLQKVREVPDPGFLVPARWTQPRMG
jgi:DNA-binding GntR family transcriptional regulator